jgi:hypothetical protein
MNKEDSTDMKEKFTKDIKVSEKKNQIEILRIKSSLINFKNTVETTPAAETSGRQNFRA